MTDKADNPQVETTELFYGKSEVAEAESTETEVVEDEQSTEAITPEQEPEAKEEVLDEQSEDTETEATEESEEDNPEDQKLDYSEMYVELEGDDVSVEQILKWKNEGLMQSDYTKKTQKLAEDKRVFEADRDGVVNSLVAEKISSYNDSIALMDALIAEADNDQYGDPINWSELRKDDIEEYDRLKAIKDKRVAAVETAKSTESNVSNENIKKSAQQELQNLVTKFPQWVEDGKNTKAYDDDMTMIKTQLDKANVPEESRGGMLITGYGEWIIDACRWRESQQKVEKVKAKVKKLPITTKPRKVVDNSPKNATSLFYKNS